MHLIPKQNQRFVDKGSESAEALVDSISGSMNGQKRYTVRYREPSSRRIENCYYADDAFEARILAMEAVPYIKAHPHAIDLIRCEEFK
tara:strand:- start:42 stop:305 length:264 start_codon:yes stop_codon:yes gene_type:complete